MMAPQFRSALSGALMTVVTLFGGLLLGAGVGLWVFDSLPGHSLISPSAVHISLAALPAVAGFLGGGAAWGMWLGWFAGSRAWRRMAAAGMLGFAPITLVLGLALSAVEPYVVAQTSAWLPIHRLFTLMFVPTTFVVAGLSAWALGRGLRKPALAGRLFWMVGGAAAAAFLLVNLGLEALGWVVGGPNAAARSTMLTVTGLGSIAAALAGGAVLGARLAGRKDQPA